MPSATTRAPGARTLLHALLMAGSIVAGIVACLALDNPGGILLLLPYALTGAYLVIRIPGNSIGWLLMLAAWGVGLGTVPAEAAWSAAPAGDLDVRSATVLWASSCAWVALFVGLVGLALVFPEGTMPGGRARVPSWLLFGGTILVAVLIAVDPYLPSTSGLKVANPLALAPEAAAWSTIPTADTLYWVMLVPLTIGFAALLIRSHRATGSTRLQYRWLVAAIALVTITASIWAVATVALGHDPVGPTYVLALLAFMSVPIAIVIAVLRYRLFEIDRLISRTLAYAIVTATLALVFISVVLGLQAVLEQFVGANTIAVAASTLIVAALFQPLRRRVQAVVDRRFNRARYDAQRTADAFAAQMRDETDLGMLAGQLSSVVDRALEPQASWLWVRQREAR